MQVKQVRAPCQPSCDWPWQRTLGDRMRSGTCDVRVSIALPPVHLTIDSFGSDVVGRWVPRDFGTGTNQSSSQTSKPDIRDLYPKTLCCARSEKTQTSKPDVDLIPSAVLDGRREQLALGALVISIIIMNY